MIVLVSGDRNWTSKRDIYNILSSFPEDTIVIEGEAKGADTLARVVANELGFAVEQYPANWKKYGRAAGPIRNRQMLDTKPDVVIGFHHNILESKGTKDCLDEAKKRGIRTYLWDGKSLNEYSVSD